MPLSTQTCNERLADAERERRAAIVNAAGLDDKVLEKAINDAEAKVQSARERQDCI